MHTKILIIICIILLTAGCGVQSDAQLDAKSGAINVTDSTLHTVQVQPLPQTVLALSSSIGEIWLLAGGELTGVTSDAIGERELDLPDDIVVLGTVKDPNLERILELQPDLVLLSHDISSHTVIAETLQSTGIPYYTAKIETLDEYLKVLGDFVQITGDTESFERNGDEVRLEVERLLSILPETSEHVTALFLRAYSSGVKVMAYEHTVCTILSDIGVENIAARQGFPLDDLSVEAIIEADPDCILVITMGDTEAAIASLEHSLLSNPAFSGLTAVQNGKLIMLPKELYHYKPNNRWGEAYENLLKIFYPETYAEE